MTGAAPWSWPYPWSTTYDCGDDYPAEERYVKDLSDCIGDTEATRNTLFCYVNNTVSTDEISPSGINDDWYLTELGEDISSITEIDTPALLESSIVLPWNADYDNVDCFSWTHGTVRSSGWHACNASQENLVFYYTDTATGDINNTYGGISTDLAMNSSYYLCYDELECTTETSACDESANYHCVGRMNDTAGSAWYPCDTTLLTPTVRDTYYYRCCKGGCEGMEMMCAGRLLNQEGTLNVNFTSCVEDGSSGCCGSSTDCVYQGTCYNYLQSTSINEINMQCRESNHWCPYNFRYDSSFDRCVANFEACYDPTEEVYCNSVYGTTDTEIWEQDSGCIQGNTDGTETIDDYTVYNESCVPSVLEGIDYFFYQDIEVR